MADGADATGGGVCPQLTTDGGHIEMDITDCAEIACIGPDIAFDMITTETCGDE